MAQPDVNICKNCGTPLVPSADGQYKVCPACDTTYDVYDQMVKHVVEGVVKVDGLTTKTQLHNRARVSMEEGDYAEAARFYRDIIDVHDAEDADAWWGLACASVENFTKIENPITRALLGRNYLKALEYAKPEQRAEYERVIDDHAKRHAELKAEIIAKAEVERKLREAQLAREQAEKEAQLAEERRRAQEAELAERRRAEEAELAERKRAEKEAREELRLRKELEREQAKERERQKKEEERAKREREKLERERLAEQEEEEMRREKEAKKRARYMRKRSSGYVRFGHKLNILIWLLAVLLAAACFPNCRVWLMTKSDDFPVIESAFKWIDDVVYGANNCVPEFMRAEFTHEKVPTNYRGSISDIIRDNLNMKEARDSYPMVLLLITLCVLACALPFGRFVTHRAIRRWLFWLAVAIIVFGVSITSAEGVLSVSENDTAQDRIVTLFKNMLSSLAGFAVGLVICMVYGSFTRRVNTYLARG